MVFLLRPFPYLGLAYYNIIQVLEHCASSLCTVSFVPFCLRCEKEIRRRIGMAKTSFNQMSPVLKDRKLSIPLKVRLLKCFVWSVLLYGCESWTLSAALTRNIEATEMWFYRRMLRVSYTAHETNISVLQRMGQERQLLRTIKERQTRFTGHIIRKGELEDLILAGKVQGKKARG